MNLRRTLALGAVAGTVALGTTLVLQDLAEARQRPVVVTRFLVGSFDARGKFLTSSGRGGTDIDRNAILLFVFSGAVNSGRNQVATLPLTIAEREALTDGELQDGEDSGFEPGAIPRKDSPFRDARIVATGSVDEASIRIATPTPTGDTLATGAYFKMLKRRRGKRPFKNRILFNPRFAAATFNNPTEIDYNPSGFEQQTIYNITLDGGPDAVNLFNVVENLDGRPLAERFDTTIETGTNYVQDFTRPEVKNILPGELAPNVASDSDIEFEFSEPMDVTSFQPPRFQGDDEWTVRVSYTDDQINGSLAGRNVLGELREKPQTAGNVIQFRPIQGFGSGPYEIEINVTTGVTDLAGNNIVRQQRSTFTTAFDPDAQDFSSYDETFETRDFRDPDFLPSGDYLPAEWDSVTNPGVIRTDVQSAFFDLDGGGTNNSLNTWFDLTISLHLLYPGADMGDRARTITGFSWFPATVNGLTYPNCQIQMGPANEIIAASGFSATTPPQASNFGGTPVTVVPSQTYTVPGIVNGLVAGPTFTSFYNYGGGQEATIFALSHGGHGTGAANDERWSTNGSYPVNVVTALVGPGATTPTALPSYHATRFDYLTPGAEAQSLWINIGLANARYLPQILVPFSQPNGTSVTLMWQGAKGDETNPDQIDNSTISNWVTDIRQLSNHQHVRWQMRLTNNLTQQIAPEVESMSVPYTFQKAP